jgi:large subunit ribosomal protein L15
MPLQRRLPKIGFRSMRARFSAEVRLHELALVKSEVIDRDALRKAGLIPASAKRVKVILSGEIDKPVVLKGVLVTAGAAKAIQAAGGTIEAE